MRMSKKNRFQGNHYKFKKDSGFLNSLKESIKSPSLLYLLGSISVVFIVYSFSLFRTWQPFDEVPFFKEEFLPIPTSFDEIFEIINSFVLRANVVSMNSFFSNHITLRSAPVAWTMLIFIFYFFKKNVFLYHLFQLIIHLINTTLVWLIFNKSTRFLGNSLNTENNKFKYLIVSVITCIWALHSASSEAILLATNWNALLMYTFCFSFFLLEITKIANNNFKSSWTQIILISLTFFFSMFLTEHGYTLGFVLFFITFSYALKSLYSIEKSATLSIKVSLPYFLGLLLFVLYSALKPFSPITNLLNNQTIVNTNASSIYIFLERNIWLVPQIFFHFLKLILFPRILSVYQSNLVYLANSLFETYSLFCSLFYFSFILIPSILFIKFRKHWFTFIFPLAYAFYFSLFPFLHILTPTYCLSADRYCYFPFFILLFVLFQIFGRAQKSLKPMICGLFLILVLVSTKTLMRIQEWNNPYTFYKSIINSEKNLLYKGQKLILFSDYYKSERNQIEAEKLLNKSIVSLNKALKQFESNNKKRGLKQPLTLKLYGLDYDSLILKTIYAIALIKNAHDEPTLDLLSLSEPYYKDKLNLAGVNQLDLYSQILLKANLQERAREVLEYGYKKFPFSLEMMLPLARIYFEYDKNLEKSFQILQQAYNYYPNQSGILYKLLKYYELKSDLTNQAKIAYLIGLRDHSPQGYQIATTIYLNLNQLNLANKALKKLTRLKSNDPFTLLLTGRYLDLSGQKNKILDVLIKAHTVSQSLGNNQDIKITKSILASLINISSSQGNINNAKKYLRELEMMKDLTPEDRIQIEQAKRKILELRG